MYHSLLGDNNGNAYPWVYYLLGTNNEQYAVYHGAQISDQTYQNVDFENCTFLSSNEDYVFMYPVEYNTFALVRRKK